MNKVDKVLDSQNVQFQQITKQRKVNFMLLQTEPWSEPGAQSVFGSLLASTLTHHSSQEPKWHPQRCSTCIAAPWSRPQPRNSLQPQEFSTDQPLQLPATLPGFLPSYFYIHLFNKLFHKYLLRARLVGMLWAKSDRKMTQNFLNNEENDYFLLQDVQTRGTGLRLCFSDIPLALPSSVCCPSPRAADRATCSKGVICFLDYIQQERERERNYPPHGTKMCLFSPSEPLRQVPKIGSGVLCVMTGFSYAPGPVTTKEIGIPMIDVRLNSGAGGGAGIPRILWAAQERGRGSVWFTIYYKLYNCSLSLVHVLRAFLYPGVLSLYLTRGYLYS